MVQLLNGKVVFSIFLLCTLTGVSNAQSPAGTPTSEMLSGLGPTDEFFSGLGPTLNIMFDNSIFSTHAITMQQSIPSPTESPASTSITTTGGNTASMVPTASPTATTTDVNTTSIVPTTSSTVPTESPASNTTTDGNTTSMVPTASPTNATTTDVNTTPVVPSTSPTVPTGSTTDATTTDDITVPTVTTDDSTPPATPAESENTLSTKLIAVIIGVGCGIVCLLIIIVCLSVLIGHARRRRNAQANSKKRGLMQHIKVTVLGDAELQPLADSTDPHYSRSKKDLAASCENFAAHLAAAEGEALGESESAPDRTEQDGDNAKTGQDAHTLGTFGFPVVVIESSNGSGQESNENRELDNKSQDNKAQFESKTDTSSSHQDQSTTDETSKSSGELEKPKPNTDAQKLLETNDGAQKAQEVTDTSSHKEEPVNQTSSVQSAKLQDSKAAATESPFEFMEPKADDALTLAIKKLQDGNIDAKQETVDIPEANKSKIDAPASKTTGDKQVENEGASSSAQKAERMSLTDAEKALAQMLKDLEITRL